MNSNEKCIFCANNKENGALSDCRFMPSRKCPGFKKVGSKKILKKLNQKIEDDYDESIDRLNNILANPEPF